MPQAHPSYILSWMRLCRISALPSAISNVLMGYLLAAGTWSPGYVLITLVFASASLYTAGMILNDVFDFEIDSVERPSRPLPSNQIGLQTAKFAGFALLAFGLVCSLLASWFVGDARPGIIGGLLIVFICAYDIFLKKTIVAPIAMGTCRALNVLLGASAVSNSIHDTWWFGFSPPVLLVASSLMVLIAGVTWLARFESRDNQPFSLILPGLTLLVGLAGLACMPILASADFSPKTAAIYPLLILLISVTVIRRVITAISTESSNHIQATVVAVLRSLIIYDASVCYLAVPSNISFAVVVVALIVPAILFGKKIRST